jgi:hypothetical protein
MISKYPEVLYTSCGTYCTLLLIKTAHNIQSPANRNTEHLSGKRMSALEDIL